MTKVLINVINLFITLHIPQLRKEEEDDGENRSDSWCLLCSDGFNSSFERCVPCQDPGDEELLLPSWNTLSQSNVSDLELRMNLSCFSLLGDSWLCP